jgi:hypothetical protein
MAIVCKIKQGKTGMAWDYIKQTMKSITERKPDVFKATDAEIPETQALNLSLNEQHIGVLALYKDYLILSTSKTLVEKMLTGQQQAADKWKAALSESFTQGDGFFLWIDSSQIINRMIKASGLAGNELTFANIVLEAIGIKQIRYAYTAMKFEQKNINTRFGLRFNGPRAGFFGLFKPVGSLPIIKSIEFPDSAYGAISFISPLENLQLARQRAQKISGEQGVQQINMILSMVQLMTGLNLEQDILALFGTQIGFVMDGLFDSAVVFELTNAQKFDQLMATLSTRFQMKKIDYRYENVSYFALADRMSRLPVFIGRGERHLILASNQLLVRKVLKKVLEVEAAAGSGQNSEKSSAEGNLIGILHAPVEDLSFMTAVGDLVVGSLNKKLAVKGIPPVNPLLVPDYVVMMDHSFPGKTTIIAGNDMVEMRTASAFGLGGEALAGMPALFSIIKNGVMGQVRALQQPPSSATPASGSSNTETLKMLMENLQ